MLRTAGERIIGVFGDPTEGTANDRRIRQAQDSADGLKEQNASPLE